jgi:hypothetical protein
MSLEFFKSDGKLKQAKLLMQCRLYNRKWSNMYCMLGWYHQRGNRKCPVYGV